MLRASFGQSCMLWLLRQRTPICWSLHWTHAEGHVFRKLPRCWDQAVRMLIFQATFRRWLEISGSAQFIGYRRDHRGATAERRLVWAPLRVTQAISDERLSFLCHDTLSDLCSCFDSRRHEPDLKWLSSDWTWSRVTFHPLHLASTCV